MSHVSMWEVSRAVLSFLIIRSNLDRAKLIKLISYITYRILSSIVHTFYMENDAEIFPAHYTWKVAEEGFKMASMVNKLAMINSCEIIL